MEGKREGEGGREDDRVQNFIHPLPHRRTALHCAAYSGYQDCVQAMLEAGSEVNLQDSEGITALHWAASSGHMDTVTLLIQQGQGGVVHCSLWTVF